MSYPLRQRDRQPGTPGQASPYGASPGLPNGTRNGYAPYPPRQANPTPTRPPGARGPGRPPSNPQPMPTNPHPSFYQREITFPPGPLPYFRPPPGQYTRDPSRPPPVSQAQHSTYPSRLRTGVSGLVQPENITGGPREREYLLAELDRELAVARTGSGATTPRIDSPAPFSTSRRPILTGRRTGRGGAVNYAENVSEEEESEEEEEDEEMPEPASDPEDADYGRGGRRRGDRDRSAGYGMAATPVSRPWNQMGQAEQAATIRAGKLRKRKEEMDRGWTWLGARVPGDMVKSRIVKTPTRHVYPSEERLERDSHNPEVLVPITVDFDVQAESNDPVQANFKIKDRFLWNMNEKFISPTQFGTIFCEDIGISVNKYANIVAEIIQSQVEEVQNAADIDVADPEVTEDDVVWSEDEVEEETTDEDVAAANGNDDVQMAEEPPKEVEQPGTAGSPAVQSAEDADAVGEEEEEAAQEQEEAVKVETWKEADCRIIINLDVQIYAHILRDRIEWDLSSTLPPSLFARSYCKDLGLTGEAAPLIAHAITDELIKHKRDALELELFAHTHPTQQAKWEKTPGQPKVSDRKGAKGLVGVWRDWWEREEFGPVLVELSVEEMERREVERTRESRRMMRTLMTSRRRR